MSCSGDLPAEHSVIEWERYFRGFRNFYSTYIPGDIYHVVFPFPHLNSVVSYFVKCCMTDLLFISVYRKLVN